MLGVLAIETDYANLIPLFLEMQTTGLFTIKMGGKTE